MFSQELLREYFDYREDGELIRLKSTSSRAQAGMVAGFLTELNYKRMHFQGRKIMMHHAIWIWHNGSIPEKHTIDHINRVGSDNRIENLRLLSQKDNNIASLNRPRGHNTSGVTGVTQLSNGKWLAHLEKDGRKIRKQKWCSTFEEAVQQRREWEEEFGFTTLFNTQ